MRIPRFYIDFPLVVDNTIDAPYELAHYMSNVLRLRIGSPIVLFNGNGSDYPSEIVDIQKRKASILVNAQIALSVESPLHLHLGQGVSKGERMDIALQKAVELGVTEITPILTENCNVKLDPQRWQKKHDAWQKLIIGACEQSQRNILPTLHQPVSMHQWLGQTSSLDKIILVPGAKTYLSSLSKPQKGFRIVIGPEGGLSEQEVYTATQTGYISVNIGNRILRTETAAIASLAILQANYGDI
ncbi:MAG: 16S rRNA (uracil1498-N3)-methyltransferase [Patiriisocius sp.]|jgi:16S rRNA (uracil1498-N3)-methyltransferase